MSVGVCIGIMYVRRELKSPTPILPLDLLAQPVIALSAMGGLLAFIASMVFFLSLPFRLQQSFGFSPAQVGAVIAPWPLAVMAVAPVAGLLSDRFPAGIVGAAGMTIAVPALLLIAYLPPHASHFDIAWRMGVCGLGFGMFLTPNSRNIIYSAPHARTASAGGLISTTRLAGQTLGANVLAALLKLGMGGDRVPAFVAAALAVLAGTCCLAKNAAGEARR